MFSRIKESLNKRGRLSEDEKTPQKDKNSLLVNKEEVRRIASSMTANDLSALNSLKLSLSQEKLFMFPVRVRGTVQDEALINAVSGKKEAELLNLLKNNNIVVVFASKRVGKSSLFHSLERNSNCVYFDMRSREKHRNISQFLQLKLRDLRLSQQTFIFDEVLASEISAILNYLRLNNLQQKLVFSSPSVSESLNNMRELNEKSYEVFNFGVFQPDILEKYFIANELFEKIPLNFRRLFIDLSSGSTVILNNLTYYFLVYLKREELTDIHTMLVTILDEVLDNLNHEIDFWHQEREKFADLYSGIDEVLPKVPSWCKIVA